MHSVRFAAIFLLRFGIVECNGRKIPPRVTPEEPPKINAPMRTCFEAIKNVESGRGGFQGCKVDVGTLSCGSYQIKLPYYKDCGMPGKWPWESIENAWKRCANNNACAQKCMLNYYRRYADKLCPEFKGDFCQQMSRLHNGGPNGCRNKNTEEYYGKVNSCMYAKEHEKEPVKKHAKKPVQKIPCWEPPSWTDGVSPWDGFLPPDWGK